jgi:hypothetical protein
MAGAAAAGCGSGTGKGAAALTASSSPSAQGASDGPGGIPIIQTTREGQRFQLSYQENGVPTTWQVTLDRVTCGGGEIFSSKVLVADAASAGEVATTPKPAPRGQFCLAKFSVTNNSDSNQPWSADEATVNIEMDANQSDMTGSGYDAEQAYTQEAQPSYQTSDFGLNPRTSGVSWAVYQIPAGTHPTSVSIPAGGSTLDSTQVLIGLPG